MAITGAGNLIIYDNDQMIVTRPSAFSINLDAPSVDVLGFPFEPGILQIVDSYKQSETYTLTTTVGSFDQHDMSILFDKKVQSGGSFSFPQPGSGTATTGTAPTITVSGLTTSDTVQATILDSTNGNTFLAATTSTSPSVSQFNVSANTLTFHSSNASKVIAYNRLKAFTNVVGFGGPFTNTASWGSVSFYGKLKGTRTNPSIYIQSMARSGGFELAIGDNTTAESEFKLTTPSGWNTPVVMIFEAA